jgi:hypothetical protein
MLERKLESFVCGDDANLKFLGIEAAMETNVTTPAIVGTLGSLCQELKVDVSIRLKVRGFFFIFFFFGADFLSVRLKSCLTYSA